MPQINISIEDLVSMIDRNKVRPSETDTDQIGQNSNSSHSHTRPSDKPLDDAFKKISLLQELYVEFFGTFIPGFVLLVTTGVLLAIFVITFFNHHPWTSLDSEKTWSLHWYVAVFIIILSYVVGAILYRTEPNRPDKIASYKQWKRSSREEREKLAVQYPKQRSFWLWAWTYISKPKCFFSKTAAIDTLGVDSSFPYPNLREYLIRRGLCHLIKFVPWCTKNGSLDHRTKVWINIIKTRIRATYLHPITQDIVRNEGHIRLMTSIWHVALYLRRFAFWLLVLSAATWYLLYKYDNRESTTSTQQTPIVTKEAQITTAHSQDGLNFSIKLIPTTANVGAPSITKLNTDSMPHLIITGLNLKELQQVEATWILILYLTALLSTSLAKGALEKSLHYVRNREVVMILESALTIEMLGGIYKDLFSDFTTRDASFKEMCNPDTCKNCTMKSMAPNSPTVFWQCTGQEPKIAICSDITADALTKLPDTFRQFHNVNLIDIGTFEHLIVGPSGLFALETKDWIGVVTFSETGLLMVDGKNNKAKELASIKAHVAELASLSHIGTPVQAVIVLPWASVNVDSQEDGYLSIQTPKTLKDYLKRSSARSLTPTQVDSITSAINGIIKPPVS